MCALPFLSFYYHYDNGTIYVLWSLGLLFCSLNPFGFLWRWDNFQNLVLIIKWIVFVSLDIPVSLFDHFGVFGWVWVHCFTLYIDFSSFWFFVTLGHLSLPFALKFVPLNHIHKTIYFISELPKMSWIGLFVHHVWLKCVPCQQKLFLRDAGTLCLSSASIVHEKLFYRRTAKSWQFFSSYTILGVKI